MSSLHKGLMLILDTYQSFQRGTETQPKHLRNLYPLSIYQNHKLHLRLPNRAFMTSQRPTVMHCKRPHEKCKPAPKENQLFQAGQQTSPPRGVRAANLIICQKTGSCTGLESFLSCKSFSSISESFLILQEHEVGHSKLSQAKETGQNSS